MRNPQPLTRITVLIPAPKTADEFPLVDSLIEELGEVCGGVTASLQTPPVFSGSWIDTQGSLIADNIMCIFADAPFLIDDPDIDFWLDWLEGVKGLYQEKLNQDIIWITLTPVYRITPHDYQKVWQKTP